MPTTAAPSFQVVVSEPDYLVLLKEAKRQTRSHLFTGFLTDGLALRAVALVHAPEALPAIERALTRVRET